MDWLVAIVCIVIVCYFWRIFLPLGGILLVIGLLLYLGAERKSAKHQEEKAQAAQNLRDKIRAAQATATPEGKTWELWGEEDPASGKMIARIATIQSNDGLCRLLIQKPLDGGELTGLDCPGIKISPWEDVQIKFDMYPVAKKMDVVSYRDGGDAVYIPTYQPDERSDRNFSYDEFIASKMCSWPIS